MIFFCTYFDSNYLDRGLALYQSLIRHSPEFRLWVLCFDDSTYEILQKLSLPGISPVSLRDFEKDDPALAKAKSNRRKVEYYFTCTPSLPLYVLKNNPAVDLITYLDADLFFFSSPEPALQELGEGSISIIGHRFPSRLKEREQWGIYNVGFLSFRNNNEGLVCLRWWRERCLEWCYDRVENGLCADQKYLDDFPKLFNKVVVLQHPGIGLAPWNIENHRIRVEAGRLFSNKQPLIFFHFAHFKRVTSWFCELGFTCYGALLGPDLRKYLYQPYVRELRQSACLLSRIGLKAIPGSSIRDEHERVTLAKKLSSVFCPTDGQQTSFSQGVKIVNRKIISKLKKHDFLLVIFNKFYW